jgi:hypothetical protein
MCTQSICEWLSSLSLEILIVGGSIYFWHPNSWIESKKDVQGNTSNALEKIE